MTILKPSVHQLNTYGMLHEACTKIQACQRFWYKVCC